MQLDDDDFKLSRRIAPPARDAENNTDLRTLLVQRLSETWKAVMRVPLRRAGRASMFCEHCERWYPVIGDMPVEWACPDCGSVFVLELAVYEEKDEREQRLAEALRLARERHQRERGAADLGPKVSKD